MVKEKKSVELAVQAFYQAVNAMFVGDVEPMKAVWSHADDVTYLGPAGSIKVGWQEVLADWEAQAALKLAGQIKPSSFHYILGPIISIVFNQEMGENIGPDGESISISTRATHIFRKEQGKWKMIGDHVDLLPFLQK